MFPFQNNVDPPYHCRAQIIRLFLLHFVGHVVEPFLGFICLKIQCSKSLQILRRERHSNQKKKSHVKTRIWRHVDHRRFGISNRSSIVLLYLMYSSHLVPYHVKPVFGMICMVGWGIPKSAAALLRDLLRCWQNYKLTVCEVISENDGFLRPLLFSKVPTFLKLLTNVKLIVVQLGF